MNMKGVVSVLAVLLATLLSMSMSSCVSTRTRMLSQDDMKNVDFLGTVETGFTKWMWFHALYSKEGVGNKAYQKLKEAAKNKYKQIDVDVVNVEASGKLSAISFVMPLVMPIVTIPIGNFQWVVATGDVISADRTRVVTKLDDSTAPPPPLNNPEASQLKIANVLPPPLNNPAASQLKSAEPAPGSNIIGLEEAIQKASLKLMNRIVSSSKIAVVSVEAEDKNISSLIVDEVQEHLLSSNRFTVVDRNSLDIIRNEQNFQMSGDVDDKDIQKIGKFLGANVVITGNVTETDVPNVNRLYLKAVLVETAALIDVAQGRYQVGKLSGHTTTARAQGPNNAFTAIPQQLLVKPQYNNTKMYPSDNLGAYGAPAIIGQNDILAILYAENNYYKVRTASGEEGFVMQKDVVNANTPIVERSSGASTVNTQPEEPKNRPRILDNRISIELGYNLGSLSGTTAYLSNAGEHSKLPADNSFGFGAKFFIDLIYAEANSYNYLLTREAYNQTMMRQNVYILGKFPINAGVIKLSPLLGYSTSMLIITSSMGESMGLTANLFALGGRADVGLGKTFYISSEYLHGFAGGSNSQSFKLGSGFDLGIGKKEKWFWRPELTYHYTRTAYSDGAYVVNGNGTQAYRLDGEGEIEMSMHAVCLYIGIGYKWGGNK